MNPTWNVPNSAWAGDLAGKSIPPGPDNPLKARWMGIFDGAGIHGTDETYSLGSAASHGCLRMAVPDVIELYDQVPVGSPDLHRLSWSTRLGRVRAVPLSGHRPISGIGTSSQPLASRRVLAAGVSNAERADEDASLALAQDGVPHRRGVVGALDGVPGSPRPLVLVDQPGLGQLSLSRHPTVLSVDEEDTHSGRG